jgi:hypothetical protein
LSICKINLNTSLMLIVRHSFPSITKFSGNIEQRRLCFWAVEACSSGGSGRLAGLKILCPLWAYGFKFPLSTVKPIAFLGCGLLFS